MQPAAPAPLQVKELEAVALPALDALTKSVSGGREWGWGCPVAALWLPRHG